ncbi:NAD kinase [Flaviflexus equikiangi]|uniref:NAD kinase n=1 Tax=Flaviflexus equikiangi TaxID=2758573 RepID=A0ABS2THC7_9ACTO|nr:NAD kinase [Flaviflexus equikiangi]MBM9434060.1 NAD kinase [Flaviflexus equikiangi]
MTREIYVVEHKYRPDAQQSAAAMSAELTRQGFHVRRSGPLGEAEIVVVLGGDGTILAATELTRGTEVPIVGINYGHVGFLAEVEPEGLPRVVEQITARQWTLDRRMTMDIDVTLADGSRSRTWTLNEAALDKAGMPMIEVSLGVDGRGVSSFSCDSVLMATPTGSTAYSFSAGGPVVWPDVEAMLLIPVAAHALFTRPLVVGPQSELEIVIDTDGARLVCDGRRELPVAAGSLITARKSDHPVYLARLNDTPFSGRLVKKFDLPVRGWRDRRRR